MAHNINDIIESIDSGEDIAILIEKYVNGRNAIRNRAILKRKLIDGISYESAAEEFEISTRQCKRIVYKGLDKLIKHI